MISEQLTECQLRSQTQLVLFDTVDDSCHQIG